jgi:hypothetical protein
MFLVAYFRFYFIKVLNRQSNPMLEKPSISFRTLRGTMLESKADVDKKVSNSEEIDITQVLEKVKPDVKHGQAMARSAKIRTNAHFLPEDSVKMRKAYFCGVGKEGPEKKSGYLN